jgi:hypothetical protein
VNITFSDRWQSLKIGILGALGFTGCFSLLGFLEAYFLAFPAEESFLPIKIMTEILAGFLFAVTYRYLIRDEVNSHLKDGAVFAFGLVRGFSPWEMGSNFTLLSLFLGQNMLAFLLTRWLLDLAFRWGLVKRQGRIE